MREVWIFQDGASRVLTLRGDAYELIARSEVFPEIDLDRLAHHARESDQHAAILAFRDELRRG